METDYDLYFKELQIELKYLKEQLTNRLSDQDYFSAYNYQGSIWAIQREIEIFKKLNSSAYKLDDQKIEDALVELNEGILKRFKFILLPATDFYLDFSKLENGNLYCQLPTESELLDGTNYVYFPEETQRIIALGFVRNSSDRLGLEFSLPKSNSCLAIKTILARLIFDVLRIPLLHLGTFQNISPWISSRLFLTRRLIQVSPGMTFLLSRLYLSYILS